jgi:hypothetical protein
MLEKLKNEDMLKIDGYFVGLRRKGLGSGLAVDWLPSVNT